MQNRNQFDEKQYMGPPISDKQINTNYAMISLEYMFNKNYLNLEKFQVIFTPFSIRLLYLPLNKLREIRLAE